MGDILTIKNLHVSFPSSHGRGKAVNGVALTVHDGEIMALVGESGSGKSVTAQSVLRLNPSPPAKITADVLTLGGVDILHASEKEMEQVRGSLAGMVFQDPMTSLNPTMKVGRQITERLFRNLHVPFPECKKEAVRLLEQVQIPQAALRAEQYPHQFSGGMRQRVMLAMALACSPELLIADEPTTALDVTTQLQILKLISEARREKGTAVLLITHDFGVVAHLADRMAVMYAGAIVEEGRVGELFHRPVHPYTAELLKSLPDAESRHIKTGQAGCVSDRSTAGEGCAYADFCINCMRICLKEVPPVYHVDGDKAEGAVTDHKAACWRLHPAFTGEG